MKAFFRSYLMPYQEHLGIHWGLLFYQDVSNWQEFTVTSTVADRITKKIKELFGDSADIRIALSAFSDNNSFTVVFKNQEDNDYFAVLTAKGFDI